MPQRTSSLGMLEKQIINLLNRKVYPDLKKKKEQTSIVTVLSIPSNPNLFGSALIITLKLLQPDNQFLLP